jgi:NAD-dependent deacetylase sirtuin 1
MLEKHKKLLRNYSQNIDTLEQVAGIQNVIECHGNDLPTLFDVVKLGFR